jgi:two-component system chemotaxis family response regulator WspR
MNESSTGRAAAAPSLGRNHITVLLVDDQPSFGEVIRYLLADQPDIKFHYCAKAVDALQTAEQIKPTVILQDLVMTAVDGSILDGLTLVRAYRTSPVTKDIPIIVLSATDNPVVKGKAFEVGANDYLVKLPSNIELLARLRYHSRAYLNQIERDEAHQALRASQELLVEKNIELERLSNVDGLTGVGSRRYFNEFTNVQWRHAIREQQPFAILMVDIDDFKSYNDTYGHLVGDESLRRVAKAIKNCCRRPTDLVARFGGEEFIVCLACTLDGAKIVSENMRRAVQDAGIARTGSTVAATVTVSIGCASTSPGRGALLLTLIEAADIALYDAKHSGKNRVVSKEVVDLRFVPAANPSR